ncbi:mucin-2-like isoform X1 [Macrobrachium nipponense]|uniref:mucin-2-like isoform X1 n=1 Tax=Macrobrachium nipponense TaxID=159736 RepID=UPI0030C8D1C3
MCVFGYNTSHINSQVEKQRSKTFGVMGKERRWPNACLGVAVLSVIHIVFALNDSGNSQDHNVVFLQDISGISDILRAKKGDNLVNRTDGNVNNLISTSNDTFESDSSDVDPTDVPITTLNTESVRTTNTAENSDERPSTATTLRAPDEGSEGSSSEGSVVDSTQESLMPTETEEDPVIYDSEPGEAFFTTDVTHDVQVDNVTSHSTGLEIPQDVSTVESEVSDNYSFTTFSECESSGHECDISTGQYIESSDPLPTLSTISKYSEIFTNKGDLEPSLSSLDLPSTESEILETTVFDAGLEERQTVMGPSALVAVDPVAVTMENDASIFKDYNDDDFHRSVTENPSSSETIIKSVTDTEFAFNESGDYGDEYDLIVETLISTATVYYDEESLQNLETSRRVVRTVSQDFDADGWGASNQYRGFLSDDPASIKTYMNVNSASAFDLRRKSQRKSDPEPDIDDIIKGIVQLLGGNVKVTAAEETDTRLTTFGSELVYSSRINNRGPPRLTQVPPFGVLSSAILTRPPIRPPVTPPAENSNHHVPGLPPGRPPFVANTRPPFLAPLPPSMSSRPSPPIQKPYETGVPIPVDLLPETEQGTEEVPIIPLNPLGAEDEDSGQETGITDIPLLETSVNEENSSQTHSVEISHNNTEELNIETVKMTTTESSTPKEESSVAEHSSEETKPLSHDFSSLLEATTTLPPITVTEAPITSSSDSSMLEPTSASISPTPVTSEEPHQTSTSSITTESISSSEVLSPSVESPVSTSQLSSSATPPLKLPTAIHSTQHSPVSHSYSPWPPVPSFSGPRPGVVLDDSNYRPGQIITGTVVPFDTGPGDVFDVTVSAYQDFGGVRPNARPPNLGQPLIIPVDPLGDDNPLITTPAGDGNGFVSIDGRKTYFDLFPTATQSEGLTQDKTVGTGVGVVIPEEDIGQGSHGGFYQVKPLEQPPSRRPVPIQPVSTSPPTQAPTRPVRKPTYNRRPTQPPIRIDTCIVGDDSTCQEQLSEVCRTEDGVSSCYCKPGTARRRPRTPCKRVISLRVSVKVDRVGDQRIVWSGNYGNPESEEYRLLEWESHLAISNAMSKTRLSSAYLGNTIHKFYSLGGKVIVNSTIHLEDNPTTRNRNMPQMVQRQMIQVIQSHANNIGDSSLYVDGPLNPIPDVSDVNECNDPLLYDCHPDATCINEFGTFTCRCLPGYTDRYSDDPEQVGRKCESCSADYCNKRGDCRIEAGQKVCECMGSYYGTRCEIDGEVLGVAVGASVAAVVIIILTLIFLCMWSRRWKAQDRKTEVLARGAAAAGATLGGYSVNIQHKGGTLPPNQYGVSLEDRMRWAQIAESIGSQNIYTQQGQDMGASAVYSANSNEYLTSAAASSNPYSVYNRVTRVLSNSTLGRRGGRGILNRLRGIFGRKTNGKSKNRVPSYMMTSHPTLNFQQLMALHAHLSASQPGTLGGPTAPPSVAAPTPTPLYKGQRQMVGSSSGYASLGTLGSTATGQFSHEQFGLQHLNPVNHLATLQHQQQLYQKQHQAFGAQSTYGQFGPASFTAMSQSGIGTGGVSRAPTLGARTPVPLHDSMGIAATIGPMGGASVVAKGVGSSVVGGNSMGMIESSEEEMDRPYQLPRPKSRGSLAEGSDIYYEPDDLTTTCGPPDRPPPPIPKNSHPQTYNFSFLH